MTATDRIRRKCLYVLLPSVLVCLAFLLAFVADDGRFDYRDMGAAGYAARARFDGGEVLWDRSAFVYHMPVASFVAALRSDDVGRAIRWRGDGAWDVPACRADGSFGVASVGAMGRVSWYCSHLSGDMPYLSDRAAIDVLADGHGFTSVYLVNVPDAGNLSYYGLSMGFLVGISEDGARVMACPRSF